MTGKEAAVGRRNKSYSKDLHQQAYDKLTGMQAFGQSKKEAVADGTEKDKIFSYNTYQTYWKHTKYFIKWIQEKHPDKLSYTGKASAVQVYRIDHEIDTCSICKIAEHYQPDAIKRFLVKFHYKTCLLCNISSDRILCLLPATGSGPPGPSSPSGKMLCTLPFRPDTLHPALPTRRSAPSPSGQTLCT